MYKVAKFILIGIVSVVALTGCNKVDSVDTENVGVTDLPEVRVENMTGGDSEGVEDARVTWAELLRSVRQDGSIELTENKQSRGSVSRLDATPSIFSISVEGVENALSKLNNSLRDTPGFGMNGDLTYSTRRSTESRGAVLTLLFLGSREEAVEYFELMDRFNRNPIYVGDRHLYVTESFSHTDYYLSEDDDFILSIEIKSYEDLDTDYYLELMELLGLDISPVYHSELEKAESKKQIVADLDKLLSVDGNVLEFSPQAFEAVIERLDGGSGGTSSVTLNSVTFRTRNYGFGWTGTVQFGLTDAYDSVEDALKNVKLVANMYTTATEISPSHFWTDSGSMQTDYYQIDKYILSVSIVTGELDSNYEKLMSLFDLPLGHMYGKELDASRLHWDIVEVNSVTGEKFLEVVKRFGLEQEEYESEVDVPYLWGTGVTVKIETSSGSDGNGGSWSSSQADVITWVQYESAELAKEAFLARWAEAVTAYGGAGIITKVSPSHVVVMVMLEDYLCESGILSIGVGLGSDEMKEVMQALGLQSGVRLALIDSIAVQYELDQTQKAELLTAKDAVSFIAILDGFGVDVGEYVREEIIELFERI